MSLLLPRAPAPRSCILSHSAELLYSSSLFSVIKLCFSRSRFLCPCMNIHAYSLLCLLLSSLLSVMSLEVLFIYHELNTRPHSPQLFVLKIGGNETFLYWWSTFWLVSQCHPSILLLTNSRDRVETAPVSLFIIGGGSWVYPANTGWEFTLQRMPVHPIPSQGTGCNHCAYQHVFGRKHENLEEGETWNQGECLGLSKCLFAIGPLFLLLFLQEVDHPLS